MRSVLCVFIISLLFLNSLEYLSRPQTPDNLHFQIWSGDSLIQSLDSDVLQQHPIMSLIYLHKQPPMLDGIRAIISQIYPNSNGADLDNRIDAVTYRIWTILFSCMAVLIYIWVNKLTNNPTFALISAFLWTLNPSPIYYATLLDSTFLGSLLSLWFFYELWLIGVGQGSEYRVALVSSLMFYTRTFFQWFFFPLVIVSLALLGSSRRKIGIYCLIITLLVAPFIIKQYAVFGFLETSTFNGYHKCGVIWYQPSQAELEPFLQKSLNAYPPEAQIYSPDPYNSRRQYQENEAYSSVCVNWFIQNPIQGLKGLQRSFLYNNYYYWDPSGKSTPNYVGLLNHAIEYIPWRGWFFTVFSRTTFPWLIFALICSWLLNKQKNTTLLLYGRKTVGIALPAMYLFMATNLCNRYEWTEVTRMKFFLEPLFFTFILSQTFFTMKNAYGFAKTSYQARKNQSKQQA